eukprot:8510445-Pyramimonas_sp.AAC.1
MSGARGSTSSTPSTTMLARGSAGLVSSTTCAPFGTSTLASAGSGHLGKVQLPADHNARFAKAHTRTSKRASSSRPLARSTWPPPRRARVGSLSSAMRAESNASH